MADRPQLLVPITTPFDERDRLDEDALVSNIEQLLALGVDGVVVAGSTGEAPLLDGDEFATLVRVARTVVRGTLVAGAGCESTRQTCAATACAAEAGADAVLVRPPSYYGAGLDDEALIGHFTAVADAAEIPLFVYNIPKYTPVVLSVNVVETLARHPRITGLKDSGGDMSRFRAFRAAGPDLTLFVGSLGNVVEAMDLGGDGGILAAACFVPREVRELLDLSAEGCTTEARELAERLHDVGRAVVAEAGVPGIKYAMDRVGFKGGSPRRPLVALGAAARSRVEAALEATGVTLTVKR